MKGFKSGDGRCCWTFMRTKLRFPFAELLKEGAHVLWHFGFQRMEGAGGVREAEGL